MTKNNEYELKSSSIKPVIRPLWPANKKITKHLPNYESVKSFDEFWTLDNTTKLHSGLDEILLTSDDKKQFAKDIWIDAMSENRHEDSIVTFKEHMELLVTKAKGFTCEILIDVHGSTTGCTWRDDFERFGSFYPYVQWKE